MELDEERTIEDAVKLAKQAKLDISDLKSGIQSIEFSPQYGQSNLDVTLVELNAELLQHLTVGDKLILRGNEDDGSVVCTSNKTYEVREAETSNCILFAENINLANSFTNAEPHIITRHQVTGIHQKYLELRPSRPKLKRLRQMLAENPYCGSTEEQPDAHRYQLDDFLDHVQGSHDEIVQALKDEMAYNIHGFWRYIDFDYHFKVLSLILNLIESNSWQLDGVPKKETLATLIELEDADILEQCFHYFLTPHQTDEDVFKICDDRVSRFCAEMLLKATGKFNLDDFLQVWQQSVPEGVMTSLSLLEGLALVDRRGSPATISHFAASSLPEDPLERFAFLFETRPLWTSHEIRPFLEDLTTAQLSLASLLSKYCRASNQNGIRCYTPKHAR